MGSWVNWYATPGVIWVSEDGCRKIDVRRQTIGETGVRNRSFAEMTRRRRSVETDLLDAAVSPVDQLVWALDTLHASTNSHRFRAPTFSGEGEGELFIKQFQEVA